MSPALSVIDDALIIKYSGAWGSMVQLILIFQRFEQDRLILGHVRDPLRNAPAKWTLVGVMKEVGVSALTSRPAFCSARLRSRLVLFACRHFLPSLSRTFLGRSQTSDQATGAEIHRTLRRHNPLSKTLWATCT